MTILTKTTDKKKLLPITTAPIATASVSGDTEAAVIEHARHKARTSTLLVFLIAVLVLLMGVFAGICFYRQYLREKVQRLNCFIPYNDDVDREENFWINSQWRDGPTFADSLKLVKSGEDDDELSNDDQESVRNVLKQMLEKFQREFNDPMKEIRSMESEINSLNADTIKNKWFREELEVKDDDSDSYADIKIPDFKDGRGQGRFIHDYKNNQTTIVDESANRCFVYPLDYGTTLPPKSLQDAFMKIQSGYYFPNTSELRQKMRVVVPALDADDDYISQRTAFVCAGMNIYKLEPFVSGVYKRSISPDLDDHSKFAVYSGNGIVTTDLLNLDEVAKYESEQH